MSITVQALNRFPVKGLSPESLPSVDLRQGFGFPCDRAYAVTDGSFFFDPVNPVPQPKTKFLMLAKYEQLARLQTSFRTDPDRLLVRHDAAQPEEYDLTCAEDRDRLAQFLGAVVAQPLPGSPQVANAPGHQFTDVSVHSVALMRSISLINLASVRDLSDRIGMPLDPLRFRGNIMFDGLPPWQELEMLGRRLRIGDATVKVVRRTRRCAATSVNPATGVRDVNVPVEIHKFKGHPDLGVYVEVLEGGRVSPGDAIRIVDDLPDPA